MTVSASMMLSGELSSRPRVSLSACLLSNFSSGRVSVNNVMTSKIPKSIDECATDVCGREEGKHKVSFGQVQVLEIPFDPESNPHPRKYVRRRRNPSDHPAVNRDPVKPQYRDSSKALFFALLGARVLAQELGFGGQMHEIHVQRRKASASASHNRLASSQSVPTSWILDSGSGTDLVDKSVISAADHGNVDSSKRIVLTTAGGETLSMGTIPIPVPVLDDSVEASVLHSTPNVLSMGRRVMVDGCGFYWPLNLTSSFLRGDVFFSRSMIIYLIWQMIRLWPTKKSSLSVRPASIRNLTSMILAVLRNRPCLTIKSVRLCRARPLVLPMTIKRCLEINRMEKFQNGNPHTLTALTVFPKKIGRL